MSDGRPASGGSHHTSHSVSGSSGAGMAASQGGGSGGSAVAVHDTGTDTFSRYALMFTGPDGTRNHRVATNTEKSGYVGEGARSGETTSNLGYMFRMPQSFPFPKGKHGRLGEIGGEIEVWNIKKGL